MGQLLPLSQFISCAVNEASQYWKCAPIMRVYGTVVIAATLQSIQSMAINAEESWTALWS